METNHWRLDTDYRVYAEEVTLLYKSSPLAYITTIINAMIVAAVQATYIDMFVVLNWLGCIFVLTASRTVLVWCYFKDKGVSRLEAASSWEKYYLIGTGLAGLVWGSSAVFLFPVDFPSYQGFIAFVLAGMSAGSVAVTSARFRVCATFLIPTLLPLALRFFLQKDSLAVVMGTLTLIFLGGMLTISWNLQRFITNLLKLRFDQRELMTEISKRQRAEESLFREKERLQTTLASIGEAVVIINVDAKIEYLNPAAEKLCGWSSAAAQQRAITEVFSSLDKKTRQPTSTAVEECLQRATRTDKQTLLLTPMQQEYLIEELATPLFDRSTKPVGAVAVFRDVTEIQRRTSELVFQANHDALTQLPNRNLLQDRLTHAIAHAHRFEQQLALLFIDLDHFKAINDQLGHTVGDNLLRVVAERLKSSVRETDTVARLGGDEFVILLEYLPQEEVTITVARKLLETLASPFTVEGHACVVSGSIGISLFPQDGGDAETLLENADTAMYQAKARGRNNAKFFAKDIYIRVLRA